MAFTKANPGGWALNDPLTSTQMNHINDLLPDAVDGVGGGQYALNAELEFVGEQVKTAAPFFAEREIMLAGFEVQNWRLSNDATRDTGDDIDRAIFVESVENGKWAAVGDATNALISTSHDGMNWTIFGTSLTVSGDTFADARDIAEDPTGGVIVVVGEGSTDDVRRSTDLSTWTKHALPTAPGSGATAVAWDPINSKFIVGATGQTWNSSNGSTWTETSGTLPASWSTFTPVEAKGLRVNERTGVAIGLSSTTSDRIIRSTDGGTNWSEITMPASINGKALAVLPSQDIWVIMDADGRLHRSTDDGATWSVISPRPNLTNVNDIAVKDPNTSGAEGMFVGVEGSTTVDRGIFYSFDGVSWYHYKLDQFDGANPFRIAYSKHRQEFLMTSDGAAKKAMVSASLGRVKAIHTTP